MSKFEIIFENFNVVKLSKVSTLVILKFTGKLSLE